MITDAQLRFSQAQSLIGAAAATLSTNVVDLLSANSNPGMIDRARIYVTAKDTFVGGTSVQVDVLQSATADLATPDVLATSGAIAVADAATGDVLLDIHMPNTSKQFLGLRYTTVGTNTTAGSVDANVVETVDHQPYVPSNTGR